ncbi:ATP-binding cassette domain-containing protein [Agromyces soli]
MTTDASTDASGGRVLSVRGLRVSFGGGTDAVEVVRGLDLEIARGEIVALVGESGSGKSVTARALIGLAGAGAAVRSQRLELDGTDLSRATARHWRRVRGTKVGLVLQDALVSLDPLRPIGREIGDALRLHRGAGHAAARAAAIELLERVGMPHPEFAVDRRSGELSGGMRQRALIAAAIALDPPLVIADEPTTALDVAVQVRVLEQLRQAAERGAGVLLISHDLAVVSAIADRVVVLDLGEIVEQGPTAEVLGAPRHPKTRELIAAVPTDVPRGTALLAAGRLATPLPVDRSGAAPPATAAPPRAAVSASGGDDAPPPVLEAIGLVKRFGDGRHLVEAVDHVDLALRPGRTLGLVGESGSGKTTVARLLLALERPDAGEVRLDGAPWSALRERDRRSERRRIGAIWQDPLSSFDPRWGVRRLLRDALLAGGAADLGDARISELLDQVRLPAALAARHPLQLSGGQRQRVAIARAIAARPEVLICDEPVSALDVTVQARVLDLLDELQREHGLAVLFISHDLGVVQHMSDELAVMRRGRIVEAGAAEAVLRAPAHEYTATLIRDSPRLDLG